MTACANRTGVAEILAGADRASQLLRRWIMIRACASSWVEIGKC
jgi:hypothetical protein